MTNDHRPKPPPGASSRSTEPTLGESSNQPRGRFSQTLRKFKKNVIKKVSRSHHPTPAVQNADIEGASSNQNTKDALRLHTFDGDKPTTPGNPSDSVNQGAFGEPASKVQVASSGAGEGPDPQLVVDKIRGAREGI
jgi:hypothetical protein